MARRLNPIQQRRFKALKKQLNRGKISRSEFKKRFNQEGLSGRPSDKARQISRENQAQFEKATARRREQQATKRTVEVKSPTRSVRNEPIRSTTAIKTPIKTQREKAISKGFEKRIKTLQKREKRLQLFTTLGTRLERDKSKGAFAPSNIAKAIARKPLELGAAPAFIGGRVAFAAESTFSREGRKELKRGAKATPKAVVKSFDPRSPEGLLNIGLAAFAVRSTAKAIRVSRAEPQVSVTGTATKRITTKNRVIDTSKGRVEALILKKKVASTFEGKQTFTKINNQQFILKGSGKIKSVAGKQTTKLDTRGITTLKKGGSNTVSLTKATTKGKTTQFLTTTKTATQQKQPFQVLRSLSATKKLGRKQTINQGKPSSVSTSITTEALRRNVKTESGKFISTEQILNTGTASVSAKVFNKNFKFGSTAPKLRGNLPKSSTPTPSTVGVKSGGQVLVQQTQQIVQPLPISRIPTIAKTSVIKSARSIKTKALGTSITKTSFISGPSFAKATLLSTKSINTQTKSKSFKQNFSPGIRTPIKADLRSSVKPITIPLSKPLIKSKGKSKGKSKSKPIFKPTPITKIDSKISLKPAQVPKSKVSQIPKTKPSNFVFPRPLEPTVSQSPLSKIPPFRLSKIKAKIPKKKKRKAKPRKQSFKFTPSFTSSLLTLKTKRRKDEELLSGFELR